MQGQGRTKAEPKRQNEGPNEVSKTSLQTNPCMINTNGAIDLWMDPGLELAFELCDLVADL